MRDLNRMSGLVLILGFGLPFASAGAQPMPAPTLPAAAAPAEPAAADTTIAPTVTLPNGMMSTSTTTHLDSGLSGDMISTTVSNKPIPDSPESRRVNGGPESASGRATVPQPGMAVKAHHVKKVHRIKSVPSAMAPPPVDAPR
jgi:hypothetical protein